MVGGYQALPPISKLLDRTPALWQNAIDLASQVEGKWPSILADEGHVPWEILSRQGVCSHQGLRKASAADPVNTGLAGSAGMAA